MNKHFSKDEFLKLSPEEQREFVRNLIHSQEAATNTIAAFLNPETGESLSADELVEQFGEEKAIDKIVKSFNDVDMKLINGQELVELLHKAKRGECTEEELSILNFVNSQIASQDRVAFEHGLSELFINFINFAQVEQNYDVKIHDILRVIKILTLVSEVHRNDSILSKYKSDDEIIKEVAFEMIYQVGDDIYNTWRSSCVTPVDPGLTILGLLQAAIKVATENNISFASANDIANHLGFSIIESDSDDENKNGSNTQSNSRICQPATYNPSSKEKTEDEEMRNLLKD